jgi:hypothetical protein
MYEHFTDTYHYIPVVLDKYDTSYKYIYVYIYMYIYICIYIYMKWCAFVCKCNSHSQKHIGEGLNDGLLRVLGEDIRYNACHHDRVVFDAFQWLFLLYYLG